MSKQAEKITHFLEAQKSAGRTLSRHLTFQPIISVKGCHIGQKDVIIANSISSVHVKNAFVYVGQLYSIVILFRRIDINIAFNSRQTPNFACNWVPPF